MKYPGSCGELVAIKRWLLFEVIVVSCQFSFVVLNCSYCSLQQLPLKVLSGP